MATLTGDGWADEIWPDFTDPTPIVVPPQFEGGPGCPGESDKSLCARFWTLKPLWGKEVRLYLYPEFTLLQNGSICSGSVLLEVRVEYLVRTGFFTSKREAAVFRLPVKFHIYDLPKPTSELIVEQKNKTLIVVTVYPRP